MTTITSSLLFSGIRMVAAVLAEVSSTWLARLISIILTADSVLPVQGPLRECLCYKVLVRYRSNAAWGQRSL